MISALSSGWITVSESMTARTDAAELTALMMVGRDCGIVPFEQHATQIETIRSADDSNTPFPSADVEMGIPKRFGTIASRTVSIRSEFCISSACV